MKRQVTIIAALARNRAIGLGGRMPWHLPAELQHFKRATMGRAIVMGRKTWEAVARPLPGRQNIVVSRSPGFTARGCVCVSSLEAAMEAADSAEVMIIGGGQLYRQALPLASRMILTLVACEPDADTWFPAWDESEWRVTGTERHAADERNAHDFEIRYLERIAPPG